MLVRVPPLMLVVVGVVLTTLLVTGWLGATGAAAPPWWAWSFLLLMAIALLALAAAVAIEPRDRPLRQALAGSSLAWLGVICVAGTLWGVTFGHMVSPAIALVVAVIDTAAIAGLSAPLREDPAPDGGPPNSHDVSGPLGRVITFAVAILMAAGAIVVAASLGQAVWRSISGTDALDRLPWGAFIVVLVVPPLVFAVASFLSHRAAAGTFDAQATANRRNSVLLLVAMVGIVAATVEIITVSLTFDPVPAIWAAGVAILVGILAALGANRFGASIILDSSGAKPVDPTKEHELVDVVTELALAANIPVPAIYVIEDGSENAFATGRDPANASVAVTRGLLDRMDREELQGVIGHELGHVRNLDTRYALYIAVFVGLVALVTDGFLRVIIEGWKRGAFFWKGSGKGAAGALATGLLVGLFLLIVAALLRLFAPLFSGLVQAATSREREFLADATSVEFTRNPRALERALTSLVDDHDTLEAANRGTQHMWFRNPVQAGSDRRTSLFATHPSLAARIDRLRVLEGLGPLDPKAAEAPASET